MTAVLSAIRRVLLGTGSTAFTLVGAIVIGFGVPLFWIFVASQFYEKTGAVNGPVAAFIGTGILVTYYGLLLIASWVRARLLKRYAEAGRGPRASWNRSMRERGSLAAKRSAISSAHRRRAARNFATSSNSVVRATKKNESRGANWSTSSPASSAART